MAPPFSVILPTHGRPEYLAEAVASVRQQTFADFECIVVDDASDEPAMLPEDSRFRLIRRDVNGGPPAARNTGIAAATGTYLAFLDDDDAWQPKRLEVAVAAHARAPVVVCWQTTMGADPEEAAGRVLTGNVAEEILDGMTPHLGATTIERAAAPLFDERYRTCEDVEWWLRVARICEVETTRYVGLLYRAHSNPRTGTGQRNRIDDASMLFEQYDEWFREHPRAKAFRLKRMGLSAVQLDDRRLALRYFMGSLRLHPEMRTAWHALRAALPHRHDVHA